MTSTRRMKPIPRDSGLRPPSISRRAARRLALALFWVGTCAGLAYGLRRLDNFALQAGGDGLWKPEFPQVPPAIPDWETWEAAETAGIFEGGALRSVKVTEPGLCQAVAAGMQKSPWVAKVERVTKQPGVVYVYAKYRSFLTFVVYNGKGYLVDEEGIRLPREEPESRLPGFEMILLEGVQQAPPPYGEAWQGAAVKNGLKLVKLLQTYCPSGPKAWIKAVDISNYGGRKNPRDGSLSLRTVHARTRILWGYPPGEEYEAEASAEQKLVYIQKAFSLYGEFPDGKIIDLRDRNGLLTSDAP